MEKLLTKHFGQPNSFTLDFYKKNGGYQGLEKAFAQNPEQCIEEVKQSNLRGLGGAGFPTGMKWGFIPKQSEKPKFLVVNCDEGEPGTFKDKYVLTDTPHALIEGMIIACYAVGIHKAYVYIRGEYFFPAKRLAEAVKEAYANKLLGKNILGKGFDLDIVLHPGAGAYICGEETALLNSLEGYKGFPRLKPPFPAISGLFACPTVINNVETLALLPHIFTKGAKAFADMGVPKAGGTHMICVSGHVKKPGVYEEAMGQVTLREMIYDRAGGIRNDKKLKAVVPGGLSAKILKADEIDVKYDFDSLKAAGTMMGSSGIIVMDETVSMVKALWWATKFFSHESCGQCSPCREGTGWAHKIMTRILAGGGELKDLDTLIALAGNMEGKTICVFADAAAWPIQSYISKFRQEFEDHIKSGKSLHSEKELLHA